MSLDRNVKGSWLLSGRRKSGMTTTLTKKKMLACLTFSWNGWHLVPIPQRYILLHVDTISLNNIDAEDPDVADYHYVPETGKLAETVRSCLQVTALINFMVLIYFRTPRKFLKTFQLYFKRSYSVSTHPKSRTRYRFTAKCESNTNQLVSFNHKYFKFVLLIFMIIVWGALTTVTAGVLSSYTSGFTAANTWLVWLGRLFRVRENTVGATHQQMYTSTKLVPRMM